MLSSLPLRKVCLWTLRQLFNEGGYLERALSGELTVEPYSRRPPTPTPPGRGEPSGTQSRLMEYRSGETRLALAFEYRRPDGSIGASGRPDPTWLLVENEILIPDRTPGHPCDRCGGPCTATP